MNRDAPRYHPRLIVWEKKAQSPSPFAAPPSFVYMGMYHAIFLLGILWTCSLPRCLLSFKPLSFYLSQIITLAKMSRDVLLSYAELTLCRGTSRHVMSHHVLLRRITENSVTVSTPLYNNKLMRYFFNKSR